MVTTDQNVIAEHDADLERRILNYLFNRGISALRQIDVQVRRGTVELRGRVYSFYQKQLCINCCRRVAGVVGLIDRIAVVSSSLPSGVSVY
jgi:osmotically-inducible protein OsmY